MPARLEEVLALNLAKEVRKDTLVIRQAAEEPGPTQANTVLSALVEKTKAIDRDFLERVEIGRASCRERV